MGADALRGNGVTTKILYMFGDDKLMPLNEPLRKVRKSRLLLFVALELAGFGATFAIVQTIGKVSDAIMLYFLPDERLLPAAIGFPVIILLLIPLRSVIVPRLPFTAEELAILDQPTASAFVCPRF